MERYEPREDTAKPALIVDAAQIPEDRRVSDDDVAWAKQQSSNRARQVVYATDKLAVNIRLDILNLVPVRISTGVHPPLSHEL